MWVGRNGGGVKAGFADLSGVWAANSSFSLLFWIPLKKKIKKKKTIEGFLCCCVFVVVLFIVY